MRIRSMSAIRARVAELEALVDERKVRDDRRLGAQGYSGPVVVARRPEMVSLHSPARISAKPVDRLASRRLDGRDPDPSARQRLWEGDLQWPGFEPPDEFSDEADRLPGFQRAKDYASHRVAFGDGRDVQVGRLGAGESAVGMVPPRIAVHATCSGRHSRDREVHGSLVLEQAGVVEPIDD